eukprot:482508_1
MTNVNFKTKQQTSPVIKRISQHPNVCQQLRNEWKVGSKCIVFSEEYKQWITTNIKLIKNKQGEEILTVKNYANKWEDASFSKFSNNIQPIYICETKENNSNNKWTNLLNENMISNSLYV